MKIYINHMIVISQYLSKKFYMTDQDEFQVLFSSEDYMKLQNRNQELQSELNSLRQEKRKMGEEIIQSKDKYNTLLKRYSQLKQQFKGLSTTGLSMANQLLTVSIMNQSCQKSHEQISQQLSREVNLQTDWTIVDFQQYHSEIEKKEQELITEKSLNEGLNSNLERVNMLAEKMQKQLNEKNKLILELQNENKNIKQVNSLQEGEIFRLKKEVEHRDHFVNERMSENKRLTAEKNSLQRQVKSQKQQARAKDLEISKLTKQMEMSMSKGHSSVILEEQNKREITPNQIKEMITEYYHQIMIRFMEMDGQKKEDINNFLTQQSTVLEKFIKDLCEALKRK